MPLVKFLGNSYTCNTGETVLDVLLRNGHDIPYSCQEGFCHTCTMKCTGGQPSAESQSDMTAKEKEANDFLACSCKVSGDISVSMPGAETLQKYTGKILSKIHLSKTIEQIKILLNESFDYKPGQYINILRSDGIIRSYSTASVPGNKENLELHVQKIEGGKMSTWLHDEVRVGDVVEMQGPYGSCYYAPGKPEQELVMVATGSGLAPIWGIVREALRENHKGKISIFHGSRNPEGLYLVKEMKELADRYENINYTPCLSGTNVPDGYTAGRANEVAMKEIPSMKNRKLFLCGHPDMVETMKKKAYLAGASNENILTDPFVFSK